MRPEYFDSIELFPDRIDQLLDAINRVSVHCSRETIVLICTVFFYLALYRSTTGYLTIRKSSYLNVLIEMILFHILCF
jgi:hypothetical protein